MPSPILALVEHWLRRYRRDSIAPQIGPDRRAPAVVVTGGSDGIGRSLARRFAADGATIVLVARNTAALTETARDIVDHYRVATHVIALDLTASDATARLEAELMKLALYCDVLVNSAGMGLAGPFVDHTAADVTRLADLNVRALTDLMRHFLPGMLARGRGGILNVASLAGYAPGPYQAAYYASKAYVIALTEAVGYECAGQGVRISVVAPGPVDTGFHDRMGAVGAFYRHMLPQMSAQAVARSAHHGFLYGSRVVIPGLFSTILHPALRVLPHVLLMPILGWLLKPRP
jgi:short-subunit dehydrogenase